MSNKPSLHPGLKTLLFYALFIPLMWLLSGVSRSGPCNPGTDVLAWFLLLLVSAVLFAVNTCTALFGKKTHGASAVIHFLVAVGCFVAGL